MFLREVGELESPEAKIKVGRFVGTCGFFELRSLLPISSPSNYFFQENDVTDHFVHVENDMRTLQVEWDVEISGRKFLSHFAIIEIKTLEKMIIECPFERKKLNTEMIFHIVIEQIDRKAPLEIALQAMKDINPSFKEVLF